MPHEKLPAYSGFHSCVCATLLRCHIFGWYSYGRVRSEGNRLSRSTSRIRSCHKHSRRRSKWEQARSHFGTRVRSAWDRVRLDHRAGEGDPDDRCDSGLGQVDHRSPGESRLLRKESTACESHRRQEHESLLSRQSERYTDRTGIVADHEGSRGEMRLPDRSAWRRSRREPASVFLLVKNGK